MDHLGGAYGAFVEVRLLVREQHMFDPEKDDFFTFPDKKGWKLNDDYTLETKSSDNSFPSTFEELLQSWLFFGLIATVVRYQSQRPTKADLENQFVSQGHVPHVHTKNLGNLLRDWEKREKKAWGSREKKRDEGLTARMIRIQMALERARHVMRHYCSDHPLYEKDTSLQKKTSPQTFDDLALSLLVLGETLSAASAKIVDQFGFHICGWYGDATEGWGIPRKVTTKMKEDGWCRSTINVLRGQLGGQATALLAAYLSHQNSKYVKGDRHTKCDETTCRATAGEDGPQHQPDCKDPHCTLTGPEAEQLTRIIECIRQGRIPLLAFQTDKDDIKLEVKDHEPHMRYATISHIWSDGYGNELKNELYPCQLKFFRKLLSEAAEKTKFRGQMPFWIDSLIIPVADERREERKKAIRQIYEVFTGARVTIVIDNGLCEMPPGKTYRETAMKILASGWMRRLWTLQEAYLSKRLMFRFMDCLVDIDELEESYAEESESLTSNLVIVARRYFYNLMGRDRRLRLVEPCKHCGVTLIANVWKATQWRVSSHKTSAPVA